MDNAPTIFLVDIDSPYSDLMFSGLGRVEFFGDSNPLQRIDVLERADVLAVRSSTRVTPALLAPCRNLKVLATPVVGLDHVDVDAVAGLENRLGHEIHVMNAAGSTAGAVADWAVAAMCATLGRVPASVGIVGMGNCGTAVAARLDMMGVPVLACDPPRAERDPSFGGVAIQALSGCEVVTLHVPLTTPDQSNHPTLNMVNPALCRALVAGGCGVLVNCARGAVIDQSVFEMDAGERPRLAVDVFRGEPCPAVMSVMACDLATPHVAGSGRYGRLNAAAMIRDKVCDALDLPRSPLPVPQGLMPVRPELFVEPAALRTAAGFSAFMSCLAPNSGIHVAKRFMDGWPSCPDGDRKALFTAIRFDGTRTEPLWLAGRPV